jgi:MerR family mercuric resistance operon transcriptional regulator
MRSVQNSFTIGQLARAAGVPTTTLRYYERAGLLKPEARTGSNYRAYTKASLDRLLFIRKAQSAGLSLDDVAALIQLSGADGPPCAEVQAVLRQRLVEIDGRLHELQSVRAAVASALRTCQCAPSRGLCSDIDKLARA